MFIAVCMKKHCYLTYFPLQEETFRGREIGEVKFNFCKEIKKNSNAKLILLILEGFNRIVSQLTLAGIGIQVN